jgi:Fe-S-cluster containining protein
MTDTARDRPAQPWYAAGVRFACTQCGNCCTTHGDYAHVAVGPAELRAIPAFLGLTREAFVERYCEKRPGSFHFLRMSGPDCPFLTPQKRCAIYPVRPKQCATWPFWKQNLERARWDGPVKACCPGIGTGPLHSRGVIERAADETERWYGAG